MGIEEVPCPGDHPLAADRVIGAAALCASVLGYGVGAVQRVVETAPARVRRIERVSRIHDRHHELRAGDLRNLRIDVVSGDAEWGGLGVQVTDLPEEGLVGRGIESLALMIAMPLINLCLQRVPLRQESLVLRTQRCPDIGHALPEMIGIDARAGGDLVDQ